MCFFPEASMVLAVSFGCIVVVVVAQVDRLSVGVSVLATAEDGDWLQVVPLKDKDSEAAAGIASGSTSTGSGPPSGAVSRGGAPGGTSRGLVLQSGGEPGARAPGGWGDLVGTGGEGEAGGDDGRQNEGGLWAQRRQGDMLFLVRLGRDREGARLAGRSRTGLMDLLACRRSDLAVFPARGLAVGCRGSVGDDGAMEWWVGW